MDEMQDIARDEVSQDQRSMDIQFIQYWIRHLANHRQPYSDYLINNRIAIFMEDGF